MSIKLNDEEWNGWRSKILGFLITPALIYLDIVCDLLAFQLNGEIQDIKNDGEE